MQLPDLINAIFEFGIGGLQWLSVKSILRDKEVKGVHWGITAWTSSWGAYNLYYYPHLNQWLSFFGGCTIFAANLTWLSLVLKYEYGRGTSETSSETTACALYDCPVT